MKINPDDDGEYTDAESATGSSTQRDEETQAEGEYTDSDVSDENLTDADSLGT
jgi:hypothetical protein